MKTTQATKITSIIESAESSEQKVKQIRTLMQQFSNPTAGIESIGAGEFSINKRISSSISLIESSTALEKTSKIKKNKKKKRKRQFILQVEKKSDKQQSSDSCGSFQNKLNAVPTVDEQQQSDDDPYFCHSIFQSIVEELLEQFYDEIDKIVNKLMKDSDKDKVGTFLRLIKKLGNKFEQFGLQLKQQIDREFDEETILAV